MGRRRIAALLNAVAYVESRHSDAAMSHRNARGRYQLMPAVIAWCGGIDPRDPVQARRCAARLLRRLIARFGVERGLYAYAWGSGRVTRGERVPESVREYAARVMERVERGRR